MLSAREAAALAQSSPPDVWHEQDASRTVNAVAAAVAQIEARIGEEFFLFIIFFVFFEFSEVDFCLLSAETNGIYESINIKFWFFVCLRGCEAELDVWGDREAVSAMASI